MEPTQAAPSTQAKPKVYLFVRSSPSVSFEAQMHELRTSIATAGGEIVEEFVEHGFQAADGYRGEFARMLTQALREPSPVDMIVVPTRLRSTRRHALSFKTRLATVGIHVVVDDWIGDLAEAIAALLIAVTPPRREH